MAELYTKNPPFPRALESKHGDTVMAISPGGLTSNTDDCWLLLTVGVRKLGFSLSAVVQAVVSTLLLCSPMPSGSSATRPHKSGLRAD
jgi:hypothetical protein